MYISLQRAVCILLYISINYGYIILYYYADQTIMLYEIIFVSLGVQNQTVYMSSLVLQFVAR